MTELSLAKSRDELTPEEIAQLPNDHPWKRADCFTFGGATYSASLDAKVLAYEKEQEALLAERRAIAIQSNYTSDSAGVPKRYWNESLDTFVPRDEHERAIVQKVKAFAQNPQNTFLILCGNHGTGKTHLGCGIIRECGGTYKNILRLLYEIECSLSFKAQMSKVQLLDHICEAPVLVIDEIGRGIKEEAVKEILYYIIDARYSALKPTVLISNLTKLDLVQFLGLAVKDRLNEVCTMLEFTAQSYRGQKREK